MRALTTIAAELAADRRPDGALLAAFLTDHDEDAFAELLRRHGPLVWSACCRALPNRADAEDAFQAAFLVLVRRARKLTRAAEVGPWLHRVAVLTARNVSRKNARRASKQRDLSACTEPAQPVPPAPPDTDLDSALLALPDRVREAIVLCHLQGFSRREAAERLGCAEGTLSAWLSRGLAKLRRKLIEPAVPAMSVPAALAASTVKAATATSLAPAISSLVEGVLHMFWVKKATAAAYSAVALFALGVGVGLSTHTDRSGATAQEKAPDRVVDPLEELELEVQRAEGAVNDLRDELREINKLVSELSRAPEANKVQLLEELTRAATLERRIVTASATYERMRAELAKQKAAMKTAEAKLGEATAKRVAELEKKIATARAAQKLYVQQLALAEAHEKDVRQKHKEDRAEVRAAADATELARRNLSDNTLALEELLGTIATLQRRDTGYFEITVRGTAGKFEFEIFEVPPYDPKLRGVVPKLGPVKTSDRESLAKFLARAKADHTAPLNVRVVAEPQVVLGVGPRWALEACAQAGHDTVTFTGYVFGGDFAQQLKPDEKGDVKGYTKYGAKLVNPAALAKEIEKGLRNF
jgi:RNA polymerase sigma factor (sigma-70 family)